MKNLYRSIFSLLFLLAPLICIGDSPAPTDSLIERYISAEEHQNYARIYKLLSSNMKHKLKNNYSVNSAASYAKLRESSEARWHSFSIKNTAILNERCTIAGTALIEEGGEDESISLILELVYQGGLWKIESINYK